MEHLSSCYFCGAAVETEVREYPIVGGSLGDLDLPPVDDRPTVTLCVTCRRKLDRVLAAGVGDGDSLGGPSGATAAPASGSANDTSGSGDDAGSGSDDTPDATGDEDERPASTSAPADGTTADLTLSSDDDRDDDAPSIASDAEIFGDADPVRPGGASEDGAEGSRDGDPGTGDPGGDDSAGEDPGGEGDERGGEAKQQEGDDRDDRDEDPGGSDDRSFSASQAAGGRSTSSHGESRDGGEGGDGTGEPESDGDASDDAGGEGGDASEGSGDPGEDDGDTSGEGGDGEVPREAYNKVVRLLQNREFPVERGDILAVATNAYGLQRRDCEAAIDALVDRGIVEADGDRLHRPGD